MKMIGRLGWSKRCSCCNWPDPKKQIKQREKREYLKEIYDETTPERIIN